MAKRPCEHAPRRGSLQASVRPGGNRRESPRDPSDVQTARALGACLSGAGAELVTVEARFDRRERTRTEVRITGLPDPVIRESRERLTCALEACGLHLEQGRLFLNLVPAARRKAGETLDLPMVLAAAAACGHLEPRRLEGALFLGEIGIDGALHAVPGGLAAAKLARELGLAQLVAPPATAQEAAWIGDTPCFAAPDLNAVFGHLFGQEGRLERAEPRAIAAPPARRVALDDVRGQPAGKLALTASAAGGHGLLFIGPPGSGKSMLAQRLSGLLTAPEREECLELTALLSALGRWPGGLCRERPFRAPHHTTSYAGLVGGGSPPMPGEITLAHLGVLFLDELPEFRREALEALRQPLESGTILLSRAGKQLELPARFLLVAAMNPCPCGYHGHPKVPCHCPPSALQRYRQRVSGPLLDRFDLRLELVPPELEALVPKQVLPVRTEQEQAEELVRRARECQRARQGNLLNAQLDARALDELVALDAAAQSLIERAIRRMALSARAEQALRRVARTLADLERAGSVTSAHLARALALRAAL